MDFSWMAWTPPTTAFFATILALICAMALWERLSPGGAPRTGFLRIETTRGDRLFVSLLAAAFVHLGWLWFLDLPLWGATIAAAAAAAAIFAKG